MFTEIKILQKHGKQYIPDIKQSRLPETFRGKPLIEKGLTDREIDSVMRLCPAQAIHGNPVSIDLGKCLFCNECVFAVPEKIKFTSDYKISTNQRNNLIVTEGQNHRVVINHQIVRREIRKYFGRSLRLRQVSAGGENSCELELNACGNVNFDMGRFGIEFVASPRHADGIVITGPITENMSRALQICYDAIAYPKLIILAGTDAISGGIFRDSQALNRKFLDKYNVDLYVPGNPIHPLTFINGVLDLIS